MGYHELVEGRKRVRILRALKREVVLRRAEPPDRQQATGVQVGAGRVGAGSSRHTNVIQVASWFPHRLGALHDMTRHFIEIFRDWVGADCVGIR